MDLSYGLADKAVLITPAKFLSNAGGTPKSWNEKMLHDPHLKVIYFEKKSANIFPRTDIKGGVVVTLRDETQNFGEIGVFTGYSELDSILKKVEPSTSQSLAEIAFSRTSYKFTDALHEDYPDAISHLSVGHKYDVASNIFDSLPFVFFDKKPDDGNEYIQLIGRQNNRRCYKWIQRKYILEHPNLDYYKVILPKSNGSGAIGEVLSTPLVGTPLVGHTETFMSFGAFNTDDEAEALLKYIKTKFARTMLGVLKVTQDNPVATWKLVPLQDFTNQSDIDWSQSVDGVNKQLYKKYSIEEDEIDFIESKVQEMD